MKDKSIKIRLSAREIEIIKDRAKQEERTVSSYIRWLVSQDIIKSNKEETK